MKWFWRTLIAIGTWGLGTTQAQATQSSKDERDKALMVEFLRAYGPSDVLSMCCDMEDLTRGEHDWHRKSERQLHRLLDQLESEGAVESRTDRIYGRVYSLSSAPTKLIAAR